MDILRSLTSLAFRLIMDRFDTGLIISEIMYVYMLQITASQTVAWYLENAWINAQY